MNLPSVKTLERVFPGKGRAFRKLLESPAAVRFASGRYAVTSWGDIVERGHYD